jgi:hypothetical protein
MTLVQPPESMAASADSHAVSGPHSPRRMSWYR